MSGFLSRLLFPEICPFCKKLDKAAEVREQGCCSDCYSKFIYKGKMSLVTLPEFAPSLSQVVCCSFYSGQIREAMHKFKFNEAVFHGKCFGKILYSVLKDTGCLSNADIITAVPISDRRFKERGYNQSEMIARELSRLSAIPYEELLVRNIQGESQSKLLLSQREKAAETRFGLANKRELTGSSVLLIDDILTSGNTIEQCGRLLKDAGATWITAACITSGRKDFG